MNYELEKHLIDMGILPTTALDELDTSYGTIDDRDLYLAKGYFNDPRDPITGEVPF